MSRFHFVDRISEFGEGPRIRGRVVAPMTGVTSSLVAEAVGQLAAWAAIARSGFAKRPVAGIAGRASLGAEPAGGTVLDLEAHIERLDDEVLCYRGRAETGGTTIVELADCVGPMLPLGHFDDPGAVERRFRRLCGAGIAGARQAPAPPPIRRRSASTAELAVPKAAAFFADHFPRKPVFPATLLLDATLRLAAGVAADAYELGDRETYRPAVVRDLKLRSFVLPGARLEISATLDSGTRARPEMRLSASNGERRVASARAELALVEV